MAYVDIPQDGQIRVMDRFNEDFLVCLRILLIHRFARNNPRNHVEYAGALHRKQDVSVLLRRGFLLAGFQQEDFTVPILARWKQAIPAAQCDGIGKSVGVEVIVDGIHTAPENLAREFRRSLQKLKALIGMRRHSDPDGLLAEIGSVIVPDVAGTNFANGSRADQRFKAARGIGQHVMIQLADIRQEGLPVKRVQPNLVQHQMIACRIGKAEEYLLRDGFFSSSCSNR